MRNTIKKWLAKAENWLSCSPTSEEIDSDEILELTKRLKGKSLKETVTNVLEWQDRNIQFWHERWIGNLSAVGLIFFVGIYILNLSFLRVIPKVIAPTSIETARTVLEFIISYLFIYLFIYLFLLRLTRYNKMGWKAVHYIYYTLSLNLPVNKILEYKLALCRDYARLTASLLFNLYPNNKVYFINTFGHKTTGVEFKDEIYVLDQHLPIETIDNDIYANADIYSAKRDSKGNITLKREPKQRRMEKTLSQINTEELTEEVAKILKIEQNSSKDEPDLKIPLKKFVKNHYDALIKFSCDEIIKYSLIRAIKNRVENEFYGKVDKISKITIKQDKEDLMLEVYYASL